MGTIVPEEWPELEDDKYYALVTELYVYDFDEKTCDEFLKEMSCCRLGSWVKGGSEACPRVDHGFCQMSGVFREKLISVAGPFDTLVDCNAWRAS